MEMQPLRTWHRSIQTTVPTQRQRAWAEALFYMSLDPVAAGTIPRSHMLRRLTEFMEKKLLEMEPYSLRPMLVRLQHSSDEAKGDDVFWLVQKVASMFRQDESRELSIDIIIRQLCNGCDTPGTDGEFDTEPALPLRLAIFALLGRLTMSYEIFDNAPMGKLCMKEPATEWISGSKRRSEDAGESTGTLIRFFGTFHPWIPPLDGQPAFTKRIQKMLTIVEDLHVSVLNAHVLVMIGKVNIEWSDHLSAHLSFNERSRTLKLFRFASFCALNYFPEKERTLFDDIMDDDVRSASELRLANQFMHKEVLLSYRLLFGQDSSSRKLFNGQEREKASLDGISDPLLEQLCGRAQGAGTVLLDDRFTESDSYHTSFDFPFLGARLVKLQEYARSRTPRRYRDIWYDTRDPAKWLVIWAVIFLGIPSLLLSFCQLVVAIYQAVRTTK